MYVHTYNVLSHHCRHLRASDNRDKHDQTMGEGNGERKTNVAIQQQHNKTQRNTTHASKKLILHH